MKKNLSASELGRLGGKSRWSKVSDPKQRSRIMKKVSAARKKIIN